MKKSIFIILGFICLLNLSAKDYNRYLFPNFMNALVNYGDKQYQTKVNYDYLSQSFVFMDSLKNNEINFFENPKLLSLIKIKDRLFVPLNEGMMEVLQQGDMILHVYYKRSVKQEGKATPYGGSSEFTSNKTYYNTNNTGQLIDLATYSVNDTYKQYGIIKNNKEIKFQNEKQFIKLFSTQKGQIKKYLKQNPVDFSNENQVLDLYKFVTSLN